MIVSKCSLQTDDAKYQHLMLLSESTSLSQTVHNGHFILQFFLCSSENVVWQYAIVLPALFQRKCNLNFVDNFVNFDIDR